MNQDYKSYYNEKLKEGIEYQDFLTKVLLKLGIVLNGYSSKKYQYSEGENLLGAEIKYQGKYKEYRSLVIETEEKAHPDNYKYVESGIKRFDNSWLFITGDYQTIYIFSIKQLRELSKLNKYKTYEKPTSKGFLLPIDDAEKYCIRKIEMEVKCAKRG